MGGGIGVTLSLDVRTAGILVTDEDLLGSKGCDGTPVLLADGGLDVVVIDMGDEDIGCKGVALDGCKGAALVGKIKGVGTSNKKRNQNIQLSF